MSEAWWHMYALLEGEGLDVKDKLSFGASDTIRVVGDGRRDYDDIATPEENDVAADFILKTIRQYTEDPGTRVSPLGVPSIFKSLKIELLPE